MRIGWWFDFSFLSQNILMKTESGGKISFFAKYVVGLALAFCKCADVRWRKSGCKKRINFGLGKILEFCGLILNQFCF